MGHLGWHQRPPTLQGHWALRGHIPGAWAAKKPGMTLKYKRHRCQKASWVFVGGRGGPSAGTFKTGLNQPLNSVDLRAMKTVLFIPITQIEKLRLGAVQHLQLTPPGRSGAKSPTALATGAAVSMMPPNRGPCDPYQGSVSAHGPRFRPLRSQPGLQVAAFSLILSMFPRDVPSPLTQSLARLCSQGPCLRPRFLSLAGPFACSLVLLILVNT